MTTHGAVVWITGLPSSGKTTLAAQLLERLRLLCRPSVVLDGDEVRAALVPTPGYSDEERADFYRSLANLAGLLARQGLVVLVPATAHKHSFRDYARAVAPRYVEVFVDTPLATCRDRDPKGLYRNASATGNQDRLPGAGVAYEPPQHPDIVALEGSSERAVEQTLAAVLAPHR